MYLDVVNIEQSDDVEAFDKISECSGCIFALFVESVDIGVGGGDLNKDY